MSVTYQEPGLVSGVAQQGRDVAAVPLRELLDDGLLDALLERSRDEAGGLRLTGEGSVLGEMVKAVLERALEAELTAHLGYASAVAAELRKIYTAPDADAALEALTGFAASEPGQKYPQAVKVWEAAWDRFTPFLAFTPPVRKLLYTTNASP